VEAALPEHVFSGSPRQTVIQRAMYVVLFALALGFGVAGDLAGCAWIRVPDLWIPLLTACHYVAILLAAVRFGLAIGLGAAFVVSLAHITASMTVCAEPLSQQGEMAAFILVGLFAGFLVKKKEASPGNVGAQARMASGGQQTADEAPHNPDGRGGGQIPVGFVRAVRAPLSAIESAGYVLEDSVLTDANHREVAAIILKECHRLDVLIRLLESGHTRPPEYREVDLSSVLDEIVRCGEALTDAARITVRKEEGPGLRLVCDSELLEQAVLNLLGNAIRVAHGGEIILSAHADRNNAVIEISNPRIGVLGQLGITMSTKPEGALLHPAGAELPLRPEGGSQ